MEDRLHALLPQAVDHIGRDTGINRGLDRGPVRAVDEHDDRTLHHPRQLEHVLQHVPIWVFQVDDDHIGADLGDDPRDAGDVVNDRDVVMAGLPQARLDDRGANSVLIDDQDGERRRRHGCILPVTRRCATRHLPAPETREVSMRLTIPPASRSPRQIGDRSMATECRQPPIRAVPEWPSLRTQRTDVPLRVSW